MSDKTTADALRRLGVPQDIIDTATVKGTPLRDVPGGTEPKRRLPRGMNKTEALYAAELDWLKREGAVVEYWYEAVKLRLAKRTWYTPDFLVRYHDGSLMMVEVKGYLREDAAVKFKLAREQYPMFEWRMIRRKKRRWEDVVI